MSGTKLELATKACNHVKLVHGLSISSEENDEQGRYNNTDDKYEIPEIADLNSGWTGDKFGIPAVTHNDVQEYLINSHHRTADKRKMKCYRQFIRGYNFFKEQYIHKIMINKIDEASPYCYIRSKCFPSMKQGLYPVRSMDSGDESAGFSKWAGTRYFYPPEIVYSTGRNY